jgi:tripartite-type tricarboxylate transporter receptor subunit TctC
MLPTGNPIVMALVAAYCALAAPTSTQPDQVQEIINALKVQLETDNVTDASAMINEAEASLWASGALNDDVVANLKQQIQVSKRHSKRHPFTYQTPHPFIQK